MMEMMMTRKGGQEEEEEEEEEDRRRKRRRAYLDRLILLHRLLLPLGHKAQCDKIGWDLDRLSVAEEGKEAVQGEGEHREGNR
eukprot:306835-Hanusia_phi.AAC.3